MSDTHKGHLPQTTITLQDWAKSKGADLTINKIPMGQLEAKAIPGNDADCHERIKYLRTHHAVKRKREIMHTSFPDYYINLLSRTADIIENGLDYGEDFLQIYKRHQKTCLAFLDSYFSYAIFGLGGTNTESIVRKVKIGLVLYAAEEGFCKGWENLYSGYEKKRKNVSANEVKEIAMEAIRAWQKNNRYMEDHAIIKGEAEKEGNDLPSTDLLYMLILRPQKQGVQDELQALGVYTGIMLYRYERMRLLKPITGQTRMTSESVLADWRFTTPGLYFIGDRGNKTKEGITRGMTLYPESMKISDHWVLAEFANALVEKGQEKPRNGQMHYLQCHYSLCAAFGLENDVVKETYSKREREMILRTMQDATRKWDADGNEERGYKTHYDPMTRYTPTEADLVYAFSIYGLARDLERQCKARYKAILLEDAGRRQEESAEIRTLEWKLTEAIKKQELAEERQKEAEKRLSLSEEKRSELSGSLATYKNNAVAREEYIERLEDELEVLRNAVPQRKEPQKKPEEEPQKTAPEITPEPEPEIPIEAVRGRIQKITDEHKVILFGGDVNLTKRLTANYPNLTQLMTERISNTDSLIRNADLILYKTDALAHITYYKAKNICIKAGIPFDYLTTLTNLETVERDLLKVLEKYFTA